MYQILEYKNGDRKKDYVNRMVNCDLICQREKTFKKNLWNVLELNMKFYLKIISHYLGFFSTA